MIRAGDGPTGAEVRAIPIETLREFVRDKVEERSLRQVADEIGIGRSTLHKFVLGRTVPQPRVRRLLGLWFLRETGGAPMYANACNIILLAVPKGLQDRAGRKLLTAIRETYVSVGVEPPEWIGLLRV